MGNFDCMFDADTQERIRRRARHIMRKSDREDFKGEVMQELYDFMPFDRSDINSIIDRVARRYTEI